MRIRKTLIFFLISLFFIPKYSSFSEELPLPDIFLSTTGGISLGTALELVYRDDTILSKLEWPLNPVTTFGIGTIFDWSAGLELSTDISAGIPGKVGIFKDSDYLNQPYSAEKTQYSQHDGYLEHALSVTSRIAWNFKVRFLEITPSAGYRYIVYKWTGRDGYTQYGDGLWTKDTEKVPVYGIGIAYHQEYHIPSAGITVSVPFSGHYNAGIGLEFSPFVYCTGTDNHFLRDLTFTDVMKGGVLLEPSLTVQWAPTPRTTVFLSGNWTWINGLRGDTYTRTSSSPDYSLEKASAGEGSGAYFSAVNIKIGIHMLLVSHNLD